ncbi:hypothetical protein ACK30X_20625 [Aeromonas caviae]
MAQTGLSSLPPVIYYSEQLFTIRNQLKDSVLLEGLHYIRPFGGRKLLFLWEPIEEEMLKHSAMFESFQG